MPMERATTWAAERSGGIEQIHGGIDVAVDNSPAAGNQVGGGLAHGMMEVEVKQQATDGLGQLGSRTDGPAFPRPYQVVGNFMKILHVRAEQGRHAECRRFQRIVAPL